MTPYQREMRLMPTVLRMEQRGVHIDIDALSSDLLFYNDKLKELEDTIFVCLGRRVDIDSKRSLLDAIIKADAVDTAKLHRTAKTGEYSAAKDSLFGAVTDNELLACLLVRGALATCLRTFMGPWYDAARMQDGKIYIKWNQIRNYTDTGARTGRLSSSPNLQNVPTDWSALTTRLKSLEIDLGWAMPQVRRYIIPKPGYIFIGRDYAAQEMRLLAHFAGGHLLQMLQENPLEDVHQIAARIANISRKVAKTLGFAVLYGAGVGRIAESLEISVGEATQIKKQYLSALPEIKQFSRELTERSRAFLPIETLAGRQYYVEPPKFIQGRMRTFEYKLTNYKIQGSAADQSKQAMYAYDTESVDGELVLSVHDQLVAQVPIGTEEREMQILESAMNGAYQDVLQYKIISDPAVATNFGAMK